MTRKMTINTMKRKITRKTRKITRKMTRKTTRKITETMMIKEVVQYFMHQVIPTIKHLISATMTFKEIVNTFSLNHVFLLNSHAVIVRNKACNTYVTCTEQVTVLIP